MPSCSCGTIESGPHRSFISRRRAIAFEHIDDVGREHDDHHERADPVDEAGALEAAENARQRRRPRLVGEDQRQPGESAADEGQHQERVQHALHRREPPVVALRHARAARRDAGRRRVTRCDRHQCLSSPLPPPDFSRIRGRTRHRVDAEEREHAEEQDLHEFCGVVVDRIARLVVPVRVRIEAREIRGCAGMAGLARLQPVLLRHLRCGIRRGQHVVRAVARRARRHPRETERRHLAVERIAIGRQIIRVAGAALLDHLGLELRRRAAGSRAPSGSRCSPARPGCRPGAACRAFP